MKGRKLRVHSAPSSWSSRAGGRASRRRRALGAPLSALLVALFLLSCLLGAAVAAGAAQASPPLRPAAQGLQLLPLSFGSGPAGVSLTLGAARTASPARPAGKAPEGTIAPLRPTVRWSAVRGASRYDLRIYKGSRLLRTVNGIRAHSYRVRKALPANVALSWKVRGRNAAGAGRWSKGLDFAIGVPALQAPSGTIASATPTFTWNKLTGAATYEISVSGGTLALTKSGLTGLSYKFAQDLPTNVPLIWKVRGSNADGKGAWSKSTAFTISATATANLTGLALSGSPTNYSFAAATYSYSGVSVLNGVDSVTVTPTGSGTITVEGTPVSSGSASDPIALTAGTPKTITVVATETGKSARTYTITLTRNSSLVIGQSYGGGVVAYIADPGDPASEQSGLIAATTEQSTQIQWALPAYQATFVPGETGTDLGTGSANTTKIILQNGAGSTYAAGLARAYDGGGYHDWYLPSSEELKKLYDNRGTIGNFATAYYWTSSESAANAAWQVSVGTGYVSDSYKVWTGSHVRAVRAFPANSDKAISAFTTPTSTGTTIDQSAHTIAVTVPYGTVLTDLVASFTTSGAVVAVDSTPQTSTTTPNDFTNPVTYTVTAADASTQAYTVTVTAP